MIPTDPARRRRYRAYLEYVIETAIELLDELEDDEREDDREAA